MCDTPIARITGCVIVVFSDQYRKLRGALCFFGEGREEETIGIECQREQVQRSGPSELRR